MIYLSMFVTLGTYDAAGVRSKLVASLRGHTHGESFILEGVLPEGQLVHSHFTLNTVLQRVLLRSIPQARVVEGSDAREIHFLARVCIGSRVVATFTSGMRL